MSITSERFANKLQSKLFRNNRVVVHAVPSLRSHNIAYGSYCFAEDCYGDSLRPVLKALMQAASYYLQSSKTVFLDTPLHIEEAQLHNEPLYKIRLKFTIVTER